MNLISICWNFSKISPFNINKWQRFSICPHVCGRTQRYQRLFGIPDIWRPLANSDESSEKFKFPTYMWICDPPEDPTVPMSQCPNVPGGSATKLGSYRCNAILERKCHNNAKMSWFWFQFFCGISTYKTNLKSSPPSPQQHVWCCNTHTHIYIINWISFMCFWWLIFPTICEGLSLENPGAGECFSPKHVFSQITCGVGSGAFYSVMTFSFEQTFA